jgi:hypothetical protein
MRAAVVVADILVQDALGVALAEDEDVIEAIATERPHQALANRVGQRRSGRREKAPHPEAAKPHAEARVVDAVAVVQQIAWRRVADSFDQSVWKCTVTTVKKSQAQTCDAWFRRKVFQD